LFADLGMVSQVEVLCRDVNALANQASAELDPVFP